MPTPAARSAFPAPLRLARLLALLIAAAGAIALAAGPARAQAIALPPFAFDAPPGFARVAGEGVALRDGDANELTAVVYPGANPLAGRPPEEVTDAVVLSVANALTPAGFAWIEPPTTTRRRDGVLVFRALAARPEGRSAAIQAIVYVIAPAATLHVGYAGIGQIVAARATLDSITASLRVDGR